jgi:hypothetical protein
MYRPRVKIEDFKARLATVPSVDWARLAAFIDGEGTIYINRQKGQSFNTRHYLTVVITNTSPLLIQWLQQTFGGSVFNVKISGHSKKPIMRWQLNELQAAVIIEHCMDYFIIKREQAKVAMAFIELKTTSYRGSKLPSEVLAQREALAQEIQHINKGIKLVS